MKTAIAILFVAAFVFSASDSRSEDLGDVLPLVGGSPTIMDYFLALPYSVLPLTPVERAEAWKAGEFVQQGPRSIFWKKGKTRFQHAATAGDWALFKVDRKRDGQPGEHITIERKDGRWQTRQRDKPAQQVEDADAE